MIPMAERRSRAKSGRKLGGKVALLFPYPEDKCFEIMAGPTMVHRLLGLSSPIERPPV